jgi:DNA polymerase III subunit delta'
MMNAHSFPIYGHDAAIAQLHRSLVNGRIRHAYLITGAESLGKAALARAFAMALNCLDPDIAVRPCGQCRACKLITSGNYADLIYSQTDATTGALKIEELRTVMQKLALKPYEARYRVAILPHFDYAQPRAQDALLKTLEEPPPHAVLILLSESTQDILPTILSRSQTIALRPVPSAEIRQSLVTHFGASETQAALLAGLSGGRIGWAIRALSDETLLEQRSAAFELLETLISQNRAARFAQAEDLSKEKLALPPLLDLWLTYWRDLLLLANGASLPIINHDRAEQLQRLALVFASDEVVAAIRATQALQKTLDTNANVRLAMEVMMLDYPGLPRE